MATDPDEITMALSRRSAPTRTELEQTASEAKAKATIKAAIASEQVMDLLTQAFFNGPTENFDVNAWIRVGEILLSRSIPKVAAKHVEDHADVIDSADVASLRESIVAEFKRKGIIPDVS